MGTRIIFLRHADTKKDPSTNASLWGLSEVGEQQSEEISTLPILSSADVVYTSTERKTVLTVEPLMKKLGKKIAGSLDSFDEVRRGDTFLTKEAFENEKVQQLTNLDYPAFGGESGNEALSRFVEGIKRVAQENPNKTILIVTHGTILNIYFAHVLKDYKNLPERWEKTDFCAYGIVEDEKVIKDIV